MTVKIAHIADTHLGYRQYGLIEREEDFYDTFKKITEDIIEKKVDYLIHSGDLFEQPKPPIKALLVAQQCFTKMIEHGIEIFVIAGNHDILQRRKTTLPQELYLNDKFHILSTKNNKAVLDEDIFLSGLPFLQKSYEKKVKEKLETISIEAKDHKHSILMLHGGIPKYFDFNPEFELDTIPDGFDYYAMGHIHKRVIDNFKSGIISYPGSTDIKEKGEIKEYKEKGKGYNILTIDDTINVEYVNIYLEREFLVRTIKYPELDKRLEEIESKINNDILSKTNKKPIVILTVKEGDFDRSDVVQRVYDKLGDITLTIKLSYEPTETDDTDDHERIYEQLTPEKLIKDRALELFENETIAEMSVELYTALSNKNLENAQKVTENYYTENYKTTGADNNDN